MQFNSNSDFPGSNIPPEQWASISSPPIPFDPAEFRTCACITTRVLISANSRLIGGAGAGINLSVGMGDARHVIVGGASFFVKTAKGVLIQSPVSSAVETNNAGVAAWSDSSSDDDDDDDSYSGDGDDMMDGNPVADSGPTRAANTTQTPSQTPPHPTNVIPPDNDLPPQAAAVNRAYWLRRPLRTAIYGQVRYGILLQRIIPPIRVMHQPLPLGGDDQHEAGPDGTGEGEWMTVEWEATEEAVAVKEMSWEHIRAQKDRLAEDPIKEVAAMQYLSKWLQTEQQNHAMRQLLNNAGIGGLNIAGSPSILNSGGMVYAANPQYISTSVPLPQDLHQVMQQQTFGPYRVPLNMLESHIMMPLDLLTDNRNLYSIMPYCTGGELFEVLEKKSRFSEPEARFWMRQILQGLACLKEAGVSHRDMSLENLLVQEGNVLVIDMGMCLRVPYLNPVNKRQRLLIQPQGTCGKWHYMSPEICKNKEPFDGHAVDLWGAGVILFLMLTGFPPWEKPILTDERFKYMSNGYLVQMLTEWKVGLSADAMDLLQRMFWLDPTDRLSLEQVWAHPWMMNG
mmetsp:Transcript_29858/g.59499  ORF Transcript_29858/g.59499 Transcript_29858/m.59499 type:complete len:567 (+) Transcript_29858:178-1878(+)